MRTRGKVWRTMPGKHDARRAATVCLSDPEESSSLTPPSHDLTASFSAAYRNGGQRRRLPDPTKPVTPIYNLCLPWRDLPPAHPRTLVPALVRGRHRPCAPSGADPPCSEARPRRKPGSATCPCGSGSRTCLSTRGTSSTSGPWSASGASLSVRSRYEIEGPAD